MTDDAPTLPVRADDHALLFRRTKLESQHGVTFELHPRAHGDTAPRYPLQWVAAWRDASGTEHNTEPMPMVKLIPHLEGIHGPS